MRGDHIYIYIYVCVCVRCTEMMEMPETCRSSVAARARALMRPRVLLRALWEQARQWASDGVPLAFVQVASSWWTAHQLDERLGFRKAPISVTCQCENFTPVVVEKGGKNGGCWAWVVRASFVSWWIGICFGSAAGWQGRGWWHRAGATGVRAEHLARAAPAERGATREVVHTRPRPLPTLAGPEVSRRPEHPRDAYRPLSSTRSGSGIVSSPSFHVRGRDSRQPSLGR